MKTLHRAALVLALAASAMPAFAFYQVVEETARLEIAPGVVRTEHIDRLAMPIGSIDEEHSHYFDQTLDTADSKQYLSTDLRQGIPHRRGDVQHLAAGVFASAAGTGLTGVTQKIEYEVVFDIFNLSQLQTTNPSALTFEKIAADNTRQFIEFPQAYFPQVVSDPPYTSPGFLLIQPGRYAITMNLLFTPLDSALAAGVQTSDRAAFFISQSAVPEPTTWALVGFGVFGAVAMRRRQASKRA